MAYAVARMQKMKVGNLTGIENHNKRKTKNHANKDIDIERSDLNYDLVESSGTYHKNVMGYINKNKASKRAIRKDAVVVNEWLISSSAAFFEGMEDDEIKRYFEVSKDFFATEFGEENVRYAHVHMDEKTPHMHMGIVPFDGDMKLSSKRVVTRQKLIEIQDNLPVYMQEHGFDVQRGEKDSQRNHLSVSEYKDAKEKAKELQENNQTIYDRIYDEAVKNARQVYVDQKLEDEKAEKARNKAKDEEVARKKAEVEDLRRRVTTVANITVETMVEDGLTMMDMYEQFFDVHDKSDDFIAVAEEKDLVVKEGFEYPFSDKVGQPVNHDKKWVVDTIQDKNNKISGRDFFSKFNDFREVMKEKSKVIVEKTKTVAKYFNEIKAEALNKVDEIVGSLEPEKAKELVDLRESDNAEDYEREKEKIANTATEDERLFLGDVLNSLNMADERYIADFNKSQNGKSKGHGLTYP